jgi:hypothetical protein
MKHKVNKKLITGIKKILNKIKIDVHSERANKDGFFLFCDGVVINITDDDLVKLSYHVATRPDYASNLGLALCEVPHLEKIEIGQLYVYDNNSKMLVGEEAIRYHFDHMRHSLIQSFMKDQYNKYILHTSIPFNC